MNRRNILQGLLALPAVPSALAIPAAASIGDAFTRTSFDMPAGEFVGRLKPLIALKVGPVCFYVPEWVMDRAKISDAVKLEIHADEPHWYINDVEQLQG